jgi:magnesium chelatase accessory protein
MTGAARRGAPDRDGRLSLERDGLDWPNRDASRFVEAGGLRWHFQRMGEGPRMLLVHGAGAATHSWRALAPLLATRFDVVAPDLPGHGFTDPMRPGAVSLPSVAKGLHQFLKTLEFEPDIVVGHSAGAAILARMSLDRLIAPKLLVRLFPSVAKLLFLNPLAPRLFAWSADRSTVTRLLHGTGSSIDAQGVDLYARLFRNPAHVAGVLAMMANWDLDQLQHDLRRLRTPLALVAAAGDKAVPPGSANTILKRVPNASIERLRGVGHLAHEEKPTLIFELIVIQAEHAGVSPIP